MTMTYYFLDCGEAAEGVSGDLEIKEKDIYILDIPTIAYYVFCPRMGRGLTKEELYEK